MDIGTVRGLVAAITLATFLGICWWAYRGKNKKRFEEDSMMPFAEDLEEIASTPSGENRRG